VCVCVCVCVVFFYIYSYIKCHSQETWKSSNFYDNGINLFCNTLNPFSSFLISNCTPICDKLIWVKIKDFKKNIFKRENIYISFTLLFLLVIN